MEPLKILLKQLDEMGRGFVELIPQIVVGIVILILTWVLARLAKRALAATLRKVRLRNSLISLCQKMAHVGVWIFGLMVTAIVVVPSVTPGKLVAALGLGSIAIGFAFKDIFENFLAGILILFREPFQLNDLIVVEGIEGRVEDITIRDTHVRKTDGERVVIPNGLLFKEPVIVRTDQDLRRTSLVCGVGYGENLDKSRDVIRRAVEDAESVESRAKPVEVFAFEFADSSINFLVRWWTKSSPAETYASKNEVVSRIKSALDEAQIEIPFPNRTLTFAQGLKIHSELEQSGTGASGGGT